MARPVIGIIGGSGLYQIDGLADLAWRRVESPFGRTSDEFCFGSPMARMLGTRQGRRVSLSATSLQTLLDGIGSRLAETRETSRYLIGVLIFLGLLGTFYGLLETVRSVGGVLGGLTVGGSDAARAFADLKSGLESPLAGMSTAFSSSLFGLAGLSLIHI